MLRLVNDASRFALRNRAVIDEAPLQTYLSTLIFAPSQSITKQLFGSDLGRYLDILPKVPEQWSVERLKLEGHDGPVRAVAISADGKTVASGSYDGTVRLWSTATGEQTQHFESHSVPTRVRFADDGTALETDVGLFDLKPHSSHGEALSSSPWTVVTLDSLWVKYNGSDLLWLPHEYRGVCSSTHSTFLVVGQAFRAVSFFSFKMWDDKSYQSLD